jgi:hypothetical protein
MRGSSRALGGAVCAALLIFGACSSGTGEETPDPGAQAADPDPAGSPEPTPDWCPLTGEDPAPGVDVDRPAVAVKIENSPSARPQSGLEKADLVFEERVEGGITRFLAIYHCASSPKAGPVRSGRFDDPKIALPFTRLLAASGSNAIVEGEFIRRKMTYLDEDSTNALFRDPPGLISIHSLFVNTKKLLKTASAEKLPSPSYEAFTFGPIEGAAKAARSVSINFTDSNLIEYRRSGGSWERFEAGAPFMTAAGDQLTVTNLLVQLVKVDNSDTIFDSTGSPSPDISLENSEGKLLLFRDGKVIKGRWSLGKTGRIPVYRTKDGEPLTFAEGSIWVELVPSKAGEVKGKVDFK